MVTYIEFGDIFNLQNIPNYAHGCNCAGAMGKGIALQFRDKFPEMYVEYKKMCKEGRFVLGDIYVYNYGIGTIFNLATQVTWRTKADIKAIEDALVKMLNYADENRIYAIALPKIGAGLGDLSWNDVKSIINKTAINYPQVNLYVVENFKPG